MAVSGATGSSDDLAAADVLAGSHVRRGEERVRRADAALVGDDDVQRAGDVAGERDGAVVRRTDRGAACSGEVDAAVPGCVFGDRGDERSHDRAADRRDPLGLLRGDGSVDDGARDERDDRCEDDTRGARRTERAHRPSPDAQMDRGRREEAGAAMAWRWVGSVRAVVRTARCQTRDERTRRFVSWARRVVRAAGGSPWCGSGTPGSP